MADVRTARDEAIAVVADLLPESVYERLRKIWAGQILDAIPKDVLARYFAETAPDEPHIVKFDENGWTIKHPLKCRLGDLFDCAFHTAAVEHIFGPPEDGPGLYELRLAGGYALYRLATEDE